jgi:hypothetical protein
MVREAWQGSAPGQPPTIACKTARARLTPDDVRSVVRDTETHGAEPVTCKMCVSQSERGRTVESSVDLQSMSDDIADI